MEYKLFKENDFKVSNWSGGKTKQLAIFPCDGNYLERRFVWRLSSATCDLEESSFSKLPDFNRVLVVLEGKVVLAHQDVRVARLNELEQDRFDGGYNTKSFGKITDYNLMVSKGNQGFLDIITLNEESQALERECYPDYQLASQGYYLRDGFATITVNGETVMVNSGEQLVINCNNNEEIQVSVMGEGHLVRAQVFYDYTKGDLEPEKIEKEKVSFDDYKMCTYLANTQFRGASFIFKKLKTQWIDEELSEAMKKIDRIYLTYFICILGIAGVAYLGMNTFVGYQWVIAMLAWIIFDMFVISPLLYLAVVPKPTRKHVKDINNLTPYEQGVLEKEMATNERLERLLRKYKHSGRAMYDEEGNRLDKTF